LTAQTRQAIDDYINRQQNIQSPSACSTITRSYIRCCLRPVVERLILLSQCHLDLVHETNPWFGYRRAA
jgi:hypothetical protein